MGCLGEPIRRYYHSPTLEVEAEVEEAEVEMVQQMEALSACGRKAEALERAVPSRLQDGRPL